MFNMISAEQWGIGIENGSERSNGVVDFDPLVWGWHMAVITDKPEALSLNYKYLIILDKYSKLDIKQKKKKK